MVKKKRPTEAFGKELRRARQAKGWSQEFFAFEAGVARNHVSRIELGTSAPSIEMVFALCSALKLAPSEFLKAVEADLDGAAWLATPGS